MSRVTAQESAMEGISGAVWTSNFKIPFHPAPPEPGFSEGHVVYAPVQIPHALQKTSEQRYELETPPDSQTNSRTVYTKLPIWTETPFTDYNSLRTKVTWITGYNSVHSRVPPQRRPCLVLFADKPDVGKYIVAPITGFDGNVVGCSEFADHRNSGDPDLLRMVYPIDPTPPFRVPQLKIGSPDYWQKVVIFPKWARRQEKREPRRPQYILLGAPVTVDQDEIGENFQGSRITDKLTLSRCQGEALSLMSTSEITVYDLELTSHQLQGSVLADCFWKEAPGEHIGPWSLARFKSWQSGRKSYKTLPPSVRAWNGVANQASAY